MKIKLIYYKQILLLLIVITFVEQRLFAQTFTHVTGKKSYEIKNHSGDAAAVVSDVKTYATSTDSAMANILSISNYYPFGMEMPGRIFASARYRFGYNGMEKD